MDEIIATKYLALKDELNERQRRLWAASEASSLGYAMAVSLPSAVSSAERLEKYGESYFLFLANPAMEPTNNATEREIRTLVLDRKVSQGIRSDVGNEWHERFWTVLATCKRQGLNVMAFLREAIFSLLHGLSPPSLLIPLGGKCP